MLKKLSLKNFRSFENKTFDFGPALTVIVGKNSQGKTNLLEAVHFVVNGVGFREIFEEELLSFGKNQAAVEAVIESEKEPFSYEIKISLISGRVEKRFFINRAEKKKSQYEGAQTKTVLFSPEQINIVIGSPSLRRDYFNKTISLFDFEYKKRLINYEAALRKRNKVLELKLPVDRLKQELVFWNDYLTKQGGYLTRHRQLYVDFLNKNQRLDSKKFSISYLKSEINDEVLREHLSEEMRLRKTLVGPQKDDFQIAVDGKNVHHFGSRSEQRLSIFWLKLNEIKYFEQEYQKKPIILLDDIFSELDQENQKVIVRLVRQYQTLATTTELKLLDLINFPDNAADHTINL